MNAAEKQIARRKTRTIQVGPVSIGSEHPIAVQSMCATRTQDLAATLKQIHLLEEHQADVIRIAIDSKKDVEALAEIRKQTKACLVVDLQENYRLSALVAPYVQKIRYNPGHLHHHEKDKSIFEKVRFIVDVARQHDCAIRIGINFGSLDPVQQAAGAVEALNSAQEVNELEVALKSAAQHIEIMGELNFENFLVSLKSSDPNDVMEINREFVKRHDLIPLHLGVTEAGMLPMGEIKTRVAFENLLAEGIGDTVRVSLTLPYDKKYQEVEVGKKIIADVAAGRFRSVPRFVNQGLNIISCPSCSRVENEAFVELAQKVKELSSFAAEENLTIAVMGCRVNGPGETDDADLGLWCAPKHVNLKRQKKLVGAFSYEEILPRVEKELRELIAAKKKEPVAV